MVTQPTSNIVWRLTWTQFIWVRNCSFTPKSNTLKIHLHSFHYTLRNISVACVIMRQILKRIWINMCKPSIWTWSTTSVSCVSPLGTKTIKLLPSEWKVAGCETKIYSNGRSFLLALVSQWIIIFICSYMILINIWTLNVCYMENDSYWLIRVNYNFYVLIYDNQYLNFLCSS